MLGVMGFSASNLPVLIRVRVVLAASTAIPFLLGVNSLMRSGLSCCICSFVPCASRALEFDNI